MLSPAPRHPALQLVSASVAGRQRGRQDACPTQTPAAIDARWSLAAAAAHAIEGGPAAIIRPERRHRLIRLAGNLGLRPFDANLIIAIVQDQARTGAGPLGPGVADHLSLVREPAGREPPPAVLSLLTAGVIGAMLATWMVLWILGG